MNAKADSGGLESFRNALGTADPTNGEVVVIVHADPTVVKDGEISEGTILWDVVRTI